ncbi:flagellar export chaperone FliS [Methylomonas sp. AM2-LC]|uniref:flagellar export chaperone FliS n=1 Tax=Methylomonas sp. AM2-LC TaxID=3153301 RepID=UPI003266C83B
MIATANRRAANHYVDVLHNSSLGEDSPHRLIQMLMEGFLVRINSAKGAMLHGEIEAKSRYISNAMGIVGGLIDGLDMEHGGELSANLYSLYEYINFRLLEANSKNSVEILDEVAGLLRNIKEAWDAIG